MSARGCRFDDVRTRGSRCLYDPRTHRAILGASVLQTPGSIQSEIAKVDGEIAATGEEIAAAARAHGGPTYTTADALAMFEAAAHGQAPAPVATSQDKVVRFYNDVWLAFAHAWKQWRAGNSSWWHNLWTNEAPTAEAFQKKLVGYREAARRLGVALHSAEPDIEGMSIADPRRAGIGDALAELGTVGKYALWGGLALGGTFLIVEIVKAARSK